jgi:hypothetical protein
MGKAIRDNDIGQLANRLEAIETRFGGIQRNVPRGRVSRFDPRSAQQLATGGMQGGDRMIAHGYAAQYAKALVPFMQRRDLVVVELGVLRGSGLAMWCELFPRARRIIGLDVDTAHFRSHRSTLERLGAFRRQQPEVHEFDELSPNAPARLAQILAGVKVDLFVHDALHYDSAILATLEHAHRHFAEPFRCFVEDNNTVAHQLRSLYGDRYAVAAAGRLTVLWGNA